MAKRARKPKGPKVTEVAAPEGSTSTAGIGSPAGEPLRRLNDVIVEPAAWGEDEARANLEAKHKERQAKIKKEMDDFDAPRSDQKVRSATGMPRYRNGVPITAEGVVIKASQWTKDEWRAAMEDRFLVVTPARG